MDERGLARRPSIAPCRSCVATTASPTSMAASARTPPSTCADPASTRPRSGAWTVELASFLYTAERTSPMHGALAVLLGLNGLRVSEACGANIEHLGLERGHRILRIVARGTSRPASRSCRARLAPSTWRSANAAKPIVLRRSGERLDTRTAYRWVRAVGVKQGLTGSTHICCTPRSSWPPWTPESLCATCRSPPATPIPRTTTIHDRRRQNYDRQAAYAVVAFVTNG
jgi:integrase/recombinase XerD